MRRASFRGVAHGAILRRSAVAAGVDRPALRRRAPTNRWDGKISPGYRTARGLLEAWVLAPGLARRGAGVAALAPAGTHAGTEVRLEEAAGGFPGCLGRDDGGTRGGAGSGEGGARGCSVHA